MGRSRSAPWIVGTVFLCLVLLLGGYMLLIAPRLDVIAQTRAQTAGIEAQNEALRQRTAVLREQFENLDTYKAELADLRVQVPTEAHLADLIREVEATAEEAGVTSVTVGAADASSLVPAEPVVVETPAEENAEENSEAAEGEDGATDDEAGDDSTTAAVTVESPAPTGSAAIEGFASIPLTVTVLGDADAVRDFVGRLQTGMDRLVLVDTLTAVAQDDTEASGGRPSTAVGDLEMTITGYAYVLQDLAAVPAEPAGDEAEAALPTPSGHNPFAPVSPSGD